MTVSSTYELSLDFEWQINEHEMQHIHNDLKIESKVKELCFSNEIRRHAYKSFTFNFVTTFQALKTLTQNTFELKNGLICVY